MPTKAVTSYQSAFLGREPGDGLLESVVSRTEREARATTKRQVSGRLRRLRPGVRFRSPSCSKLLRECFGPASLNPGQVHDL